MGNEKIHPYIGDTVGYKHEGNNHSEQRTLWLVSAVRVEPPNSFHPDDCVVYIWDPIENAWVREEKLDFIIHPIETAERPVEHYQRNANGEWEAV